MNAITVIILFTLIAGTVLDVLAAVFSLRMLNNEPPKDFEDVFDSKDG